MTTVFLASNIDRSAGNRFLLILLFLYLLLQHSFNQYYCYITISKIILPACVKASLAKTQISCHKIMKNILKNMHFFVAQYCLMRVKTKLNVYCCCKWELHVYIQSSLANLYNKNSLQNNCKQINTSLPKFKLKYQTSGGTSQLLQVLFTAAKHSQSFLLNSCYQDKMQQFSHVKAGIFDGRYESSVINMILKTSEKQRMP